MVKLLIVFTPKTRARARNVFALLAILAFIQGCEPKLHNPPKTSPCTYTFTNVFKGCYSKQSGSTVISYKATLIVYFYSGNDRQELMQYDVTSSPTPSTTLTIIGEAPSDNTPWSIEITIQGTQCSTCAVTQYGNGYNCLQFQTLTGIEAAVPVLWAVSGIRVGYSPTGGGSTYAYIENVANSCGCIVPY